jgi:archaellum component FlaG (FlaF/FlaG flagellin family)
MNTRKLLALTLILGLLLPATGAAASLAGPCVPGAVYDPACDVDHDGDVDIFDIQTTAGHWNQTGPWVSDNNHTHLGQTWTGNSVPLKIGGSYGPPEFAPLVLSNSHSVGNGLFVDSVNNNAVEVVSAGRGMYVGTTTYDAMYVDHAGYDGLAICRTGSAVGCTHSNKNNGFEIANAQDDGVHVVHAGGDGLFVCQTGSAGACTPDSGDHGVEIGNTQNDGIRITDAGDDGIQIGNSNSVPTYGLYVPSPGTPNDTLLPNTANPAGQWALFTVDNIEAGNVFASAYTLVAVVGGDIPLEPGQVVSAAGLAETIPGGHNPLAQVHLAAPGSANVAGVVDSRMALEPLPGKAGDMVLHGVDGPARPGDYVAITVMGATQVRLQPGAVVQPGERVTVGEGGAVRPLSTYKVQLAEGGGTVDMAESVPALGVVLQPAREGWVWVLVGPR